MYPVSIYLNLFLYHFQTVTHKQYEKNTIFINYKLDDTTKLDFNIESDMKQKLYDYGLQSATDYIQKNVFIDNK